MPSKSTKQKVFRYFMGLHFGLCYGPVDRFLRFLVGEREAWRDIVTGNGTVAVDAPDLFGGPSSEGGIVGDLTVMMGAADQTLPSNVAAALPAQAPAFRGVLSLFYDGLISTNNPYVKAMAFQVERITAGWNGGTAWYAEKAPIPVGNGAAISYAEGVATLDQWTLESGYFVFENSTNEYGLVFHCLPQDADEISTVSRTLDLGFLPDHLAFYFRVASDNSDDAAAFGVGNWVYVQPRREGFYDPARRCHLYIAGSLIYVDTLDIAAWYHFTLDVTDGVAAWEIRRVSDDYLHASGTSGSSNFATAPTGMSFSEDQDGLTCPTDYAGIEMSSSLGVVFNGMNPAHIVYQCLTDPQWGMGYPTASIDNDSFTAAADTLFGEGFGLCLLWNSSDEIGSFVGKVLDHAGGVLYTDPQTGKFKLQLLRADYDVGTLPVFDESNIVALESFQRVGYGDTVNEIVVVYCDVETNTDVPVAVQNLANITAQGGVVSTTRQYPGLPNEALALRVAQRDLDASSIPLAKARIKVNRKGWSLTPGACFKFTWPKLGLTTVVMRVLDIDTGTLEDGTITMNCAEDVFGLPDSTYAEQEPPGWVAPSTDPEPITRQAMIEAPYYLLAHGMTAGDLAALDADASYFGALACKPTSLSVGYAITSRVGVAAYAQTGSGLFVAGGDLAGDLGQEAASFVLAAATDLDRVTAGMLAIVGDGRAAEIMQVLTVDTGTSTITVDRAVLDTTPQEHTTGAPVFFIVGDGEESRDTVERATAEEVDYKLLPQTTGAQLEAALATEITVTADQRQARPLPAGNLQLNGVQWPASVVGTITVTWSHRDRTQQTEGITLQTDADIGPEPGTTYTLRAYDDDTDDLLAEVAGITGTSQALALSGGNVRVEHSSVRDGLESWQAQVRVFGVLGDGFVTEGGDLLLTEDGGQLIPESGTSDVARLVITLALPNSGSYLYVGAFEVNSEIWAHRDDGYLSVARFNATTGAQIGSVTNILSAGEQATSYPDFAGASAYCTDGTTYYMAVRTRAGACEIRAVDSAAPTTVVASADIGTPIVGLAHDGTDLWAIINDGSDTLLMQRDSATLASIANYSISGQLRELHFAGGSLWADCFGSTELVEIDPADGSELSRTDYSSDPTLMRTLGFSQWLAGYSYSTDQSVYAYSTVIGAARAAPWGAGLVACINADTPAGYVSTYDASTGEYIEDVAVSAGLRHIAGSVGDVLFVAEQAGSTWRLKGYERN